MNFKEYIDCFDDISSLPREQQFTILEKAHSEITSKAVISPFTLLSFVLPIGFIVLISALFYFFMGYSIGLVVTSIFLGLLSSRIAINEISTSLMQNKVKEIQTRTTCQAERAVNKTKANH